MRLVRIRSVKPVRDFVVHIEFTDGSVRDIDLTPHLRGKIFEPIRMNMDLFRSVKVDKRMKTICWDNGADLDPDTLYHDLKPAWADESGVKFTK